MDDEIFIKQKEAINHLQRIEIRFHIFKLVVVVIAAVVTALSVIYYVRKDNDQTRSLVCEIAGRAGIQAKECK